MKFFTDFKQITNIVTYYINVSSYDIHKLIYIKEDFILVHKFCPFLAKKLRQPIPINNYFIDLLHIKSTCNVVKG